MGFRTSLGTMYTEGKVTALREKFIIFGGCPRQNFCGVFCGCFDIDDENIVKSLLIIAF